MGIVRDVVWWVGVGLVVMAMLIPGTLGPEGLASVLRADVFAERYEALLFGCLSLSLIALVETADVLAGSHHRIQSLVGSITVAFLVLVMIATSIWYGAAVYSGTTPVVGDVRGMLWLVGLVVGFAVLAKLVNTARASA